MTLEALLARIADQLKHGPIDVREFVASYYPHDIEAGQLLMRAFDAYLLRGRFTSRLVEFDGRISGFTAGSPPVWH